MLQRTAYARERAGRARRRGAAARAAGRARVRGARSTRRSHGVIERCAAEGVNPGYPLGADYPEFEDGLLVAITEQRSRARHRPAGRGARPRRRRRSAARAARGGDAHEPHRDAAAARPRDDDLREVAARAGARSCRPSSTCRERPLDELPERFRRARAAAAARDRRARDRPPLQPHLASATSTSTPASIRSARAR